MKTEKKDPGQKKSSKSKSTTVNSNYSKIGELEMRWQELNEKMKEFDKKFEAWQEEWNKRMNEPIASMTGISDLPEKCTIIETDMVSAQPFTIVGIQTEDGDEYWTVTIGGKRLDNRLYPTKTGAIQKVAQPNWQSINAFINAVLESQKNQQ